MSNEKLPLLSGIVQPLHVGVGAAAETLEIFRPPDASNVKNPVTYEVHAWLIQTNLNPVPAGQRFAILSVQGDINANPSKLGLAYSEEALVDNGFAQGVLPVKVLDGYPVRGDVGLYAAMSGAAADPYPNGPQIWGYYHIVGQGTRREPERRFIGDRGLQGYNAGVPLLLAMAANGVVSSNSEILHYFEPDRIDDLCISFQLGAGDGAGASDAIVLVTMTFEDANNQPLFAGHALNFLLTKNYGTPVYNGTPAPPVPPGLPLSTPYWFQGSFGNPSLDHLRVVATRIEGDQVANVGVHGYFTRH